MSGTLRAERDGPHVKLTMQHPEGFDHSFMVERFHGMKLDEDPKSPTFGTEIEDWRPIHSGIHKFVHGTDTTYEMARHPHDPELPPQPLPGPRRYRALAYRLAEVSRSGVKILHTEGVYTATVHI